MISPLVLLSECIELDFFRQNILIIQLKSIYHSSFHRQRQQFILKCIFINNSIVFVGKIQKEISMFELQSQKVKFQNPKMLLQPNYNERQV